MTRASVVIPTYNASEYLGKCVESVLAQSERSLEVIIVDDGSTDATRKVTEFYSAKDPRIKVIRQANQGVSSARNTGLAAASGDYLFFVDADDWIDRKMVGSMIEEITKNKSKMAVCGVTYDYLDKVDRVIRSKIYVPNSMTLNRDKSLNENLINIEFLNLLGYSSNKAYEREWLMSNQIKYPERTSLFEDLDFNCQAIALGKSVVFLPEPYLHYVHRPTDSLSSARAQDYLGARAKAIAKYEKILSTWNLKDEAWLRWQTIMAASVFWSVLAAAAGDDEPIRRLEKMLDHPQTERLLTIGKNVSMRYWRGKISTLLIYLNLKRVALAPFVLRKYLNRKFRN